MVELGLRSERPGSRKYKSGEARARVDGNTCGFWRAWQFPFSIPCGTPKTCRPGWQGKRRWIASSRLGLARWQARRKGERLETAWDLRPRRSVRRNGMFETYRCRCLRGKEKRPSLVLQFAPRPRCRQLAHKYRTQDLRKEAPATHTHVAWPEPDCTYYCTGGVCRIPAAHSIATRTTMAAKAPPVQYAVFLVSGVMVESST